VPVLAGLTAAAVRTVLTVFLLALATLADPSLARVVRLRAVIILVTLIALAALTIIALAASAATLLLGLSGQVVDLGDAYQREYRSSGTRNQPSSHCSARCQLRDSLRKRIESLVIHVPLLRTSVSGRHRQNRAVRQHRVDQHADLFEDSILVGGLHQSNKSLILGIDFANYFSAHELLYFSVMDHLRFT
jgi:hypothetical protein